MKSKKGGVSIAIVLLVILTLVLVISSLVLLSGRSKEVIEGLGRAFIVENIYSQKEVINFNIQNLVDMSAKEADSKEQFIDNFNTNLEKYKNANGDYIIPELIQLENQLDVNGVVLNNGFEIPFDIKIETKDLENGISIEYSYKKTFINKYWVSEL